MKAIGSRHQKLIDDLILHFIDNEHRFKVLLSQVQTSIDSSKKLKPLIHSIKSRIKDPEHLRDKLIRKTLDKKPLLISKENLFSKINDLAGFRILHLHTRQFEEIDKELKRIFQEQEWVLVEGPTARTWDDESREFFKEIGIRVDKSPNMYTSVHYIIKANSKASITCEIQVRTLMEEVWGEVDHAMNYPYKTESVSCRDQIKVLARVTSSCSRLVDSIFSTFNEHQNSKRKKISKRAA